MYPRVNLLKKSEQRYQGAVSRRFIFVSAVVTPILLIATLSAVKLVQFSGVQTELKESRQIWEQIEPQLNLYEKENKGLHKNQDALALYDGWEESQVSFVKLLDDIQATVPSNIQFTRLSLRSEMKQATYAEKGDLGLDFRLVIEGVSEGARAENDVIQLRRNLVGCKQVGDIFDSLKLASLRKRENLGGENLREFRLLGEVEKEDAK